MRSNTKMYKTISPQEIQKIKPAITRSYYYVVEGEKKEIREEPLEGSINNKQVQLIDEDYEWNPKIDSLYMNIGLKLNDCTCLFGSSGSCYEDAIIGVGIYWKPEKAKLKKCIKLGEIKKEDGELYFQKNDIEVENVSSNVEFILFFYIVQPGKTNGNKYFGNEQGMVIYEEIEWTIVVQGSGSVFPIFEIEKAGSPLWDFRCEVSDLSEDLFDEENVSIIINKKHPLYEKIHPKSPNFDNHILNEVMSSAISNLIMEIRMSQPNCLIDLKDDYETGSVLQAFVYFNEKLGFDINGSLSSLTESIKTFFDKEF